MKKLLIILSVCLISIGLYSQQNNYSGGIGTLDCPYQIATHIDLENLMHNIGDWHKSFVLVKDIDCQSLPTDPTRPTKPIGTSVNPFTGNFFGNNFKIEKLTITATTDNIGLFGWIQGNGTFVTGIKLVEPIISGRQTVGALCGVNQGNISNCEVLSGEIYGVNNVGGLVGQNGLLGQNGGFISACSVYKCEIKGLQGTPNTAPQEIGGFVGQNTHSIIGCNSHAFVNAEAHMSVGGFCGQNNNGGRIEHCRSEGEVKCNKFGGGFCGKNGGNTPTNVGTIINCHSSSMVCVDIQRAGGFVGMNDIGGTIRFCSASGNAIVNPNNNPLNTVRSAGGFVGFAESGSEIKICIASGLASSKNHVGGFVGFWRSNATITNSAAYGGIRFGSNAPQFSGDFVGRNVNNIYPGTNHTCLRSANTNPLLNCGDITRFMVKDREDHQSLNEESDKDCKLNINLQIGASTAFGLPAGSSSLIPNIGVDFSFGDFGIRATGQFFKTSPDFDIDNYLAPISSSITQTGDDQHSNIKIGINPYINIPLKDITIQAALGLNYFMQNGANLQANFDDLPEGAVFDASTGVFKRNTFVVDPNIRAIIGKANKKLRFFVNGGYSIPMGKKEYTYSSRNLTGVVLPDGSIDPDLMEFAPTINHSDKLIPASFYIGIGLELNIMDCGGYHSSRGNSAQTFGDGTEHLKKK